MFDLLTGLFIALAVLFISLFQARPSLSPKVAKVLPTALLVLALISTATDKYKSYRDDAEEAERRAEETKRYSELKAQYGELQGQYSELQIQYAALELAANRAGKILPPTIDPLSDGLELFIGGNRLTCPANEIDMAKALGLFFRFPFVAKGPYLKIEYIDSLLNVSATVLDESKGQIAVIHRNEFVFTPPKGHSIKKTGSEVSLVGPDGSIILGVRLLSTRDVRVEGVFHTGDYKCTIGDAGIRCEGTRPGTIGQMVFKDIHMTYRTEPTAAATSTGSPPTSAPVHLGR